MAICYITGDWCRNSVLDRLAGDKKLCPCLCQGKQTRTSPYLRSRFPAFDRLASPIEEVLALSNRGFFRSSEVSKVDPERGTPDRQ